MTVVAPHCFVGVGLFTYFSLNEVKESNPKVSAFEKQLF